MAKNSGQKLKLLYIVKILSEETDEDHAISTQNLISRLEAYDVSAERKSIYDDIARLQDFGYDIIKRDSRTGGGYYLASREFELAELKLLVDAVQSSRFITQKKSNDLIRKLERLAGKHDARHLQRQVYVAGRVKTENESIYYYIDALHKAIQDNKQITFSYMEWDAKKQLVPRKGGKRYQVSPWILLWKDENYYLAAYDEKADKIKHYRVDKIADVQVTDISRVGQEQYEKLNLAEYMNRTFGMYGGETEDVILTYPERLIGVVIDRFGKDVNIRPMGNVLRSRVKVVVSPQFFGWISAVGKDIKIAAPESVRTQYVEWMQNLLKEYEDNL